ncbi:pyrroline-5-carboxylate reductase [Elusimicrobium posterum]
MKILMVGLGKMGGALLNGMLLGGVKKKTFLLLNLFCKMRKRKA